MQPLGKIGLGFIVNSLAIAALISCNQPRENNNHHGISDSSIQHGKALATEFCQSCHMLPDPALLNSESWEKGVLPNMGPRLGIFSFKKHSYPSYDYDKELPPGFYPAKPLVSEEDWQDILNYYIASAPDSLPAQQRTQPIEVRDNLFQVEYPKYNQFLPATCYIQIDTTTRPHTILESDAYAKKLLRFSGALKAIDSASIPGALVNIDFNDHKLGLCDIGMLNPNNGKFGKLQNVSVGKDGKMHLDKRFGIDSLQRPVQTIQADLNNDGLPDYLVCEFGFLTGALSWYENKGHNTFSRHVLRAVPGAIKAYIKDYNHDGLPDLFVLFAQGEEGIFLFTNKGNGAFEQRQILRFPPTYGSSYFELDDFNNDGYPDILYTCGDNADFSPVLKPYHGLYIFLNDKNYHFEQKYFFPINGCYKAMAVDLDQDGDLDIASISFFADYQNQPQEGFVYLENQGDLRFKPFSTAQAEIGRWLTMDVGTLKEGGKPDLLLGNFSIAPSNSQSKINWKTGPAFILLKDVNSSGHSLHPSILPNR